MPDSQSREPEFATISKLGRFCSLHDAPSSLSCINEYLALNSGGNVSELSSRINCCIARMLPREAELVSE